MNENRVGEGKTLEGLLSYAIFLIIGLKQILLDTQRNSQLSLDVDLSILKGSAFPTFLAPPIMN